MSIASAFALEDRALLSALNTMIETLKSLEEKYMKVNKTGRTPLQDAVPMTWQEIMTHARCFEHDYDNTRSHRDG